MILSALVSVLLSGSVAMAQPDQSASLKGACAESVARQAMIDHLTYQILATPTINIEKRSLTYKATYKLVSSELQYHEEQPFGAWLRSFYQVEMMVDGTKKTLKYSTRESSASGRAQCEDIEEILAEQ